MRPSPHQSPSRRKNRTGVLGWMLFGSLFVHALGFLYLASRPPPPPATPLQELGELVEIELPTAAPWPADVRREKVAPPLERPTRTREPPRPPPTPQASASSAGESEPPPVGTPQGSDNPRAAPPTRSPLILTPSAHALSGSDFPINSGSGGGHTIRPDDPSLSPTALREEERKRVHDRVQSFVEDELGDARAQRGLPHPYLSGLRAALLGRIGHHGALSQRELGANGMKDFLKNYLETASNYGKTGNPGLADPGSAPTQSELLQQRFGNQPSANMARAQAQASETADALSHRGALFQMRIELVQNRTPPSAVLNLLESSGNKVFDAHVLKGFASTLAEADAPPADAFHGPALKSVWRIEGFLKPKHENSLTNLLPSANGISMEQVASAANPDSMEVDFHATLLRIQ